MQDSNGYGEDFLQKNKEKKNGLKEKNIKSKKKKKKNGKRMAKSAIIGHTEGT